MVVLTSSVLVLVTAGLYSSRFLPASLHWAVRAGLAVLRMVWFVFLVWLCLADPKILSRETIELPPALPIVIDDSASMALPARVSPSSSGELRKTKWETVKRILRRGRLLEGLRKRGFHPRKFRLSDLIPDGVNRAHLSERPSLSTTNLTGALKTLSAQFTPERCPGFLFLTDGQWNTGGDPLQAYVPRGATPPFAFYAIGIGDPHPPTDIRLTSLALPPTVRSGRTAVVTVYGDAEAVRERIVSPLRLELRTESGEVAWATENRVQFEPGSARWRKTFRFPAIQAGKFQVAAKISPGPPDINPENNDATSDLQILEERDRVLLVTGGPDWDFKLIKRALENDPYVIVEGVWLRPEGVLRLGDRAWVERESNLPRSKSERLPAPATDPLEDLQQWSVVFLHGVSFSGERSELRDRVATYVENGGALVVLPGAHGKDPNIYWPCDPSTTRVVLLEGDTNAVRVKAGVDSLLAGPIFPTLPEHLPSLARSFMPVPTLAGTQTVLRCKRVAGGQEAPLVVEMRYGLGRIIHAYSDSFWRWRMFGPSDEGDPFGRFWRVLVHLLSPSSVPTTGRLVVTDPSPQIGQSVKVLLELSPDSDVPKGTRLVSVDGPEGTVVLPLSQDPITPLRASADFVPSASGVYQLREKRSGYETQMTVVASNEEKLRPAQNVPFLTTLAEATGGAYQDAQDWQAILDTIPARLITIEREEQRFWASRLWVLACLIGLIVAEWYFRQRQGLP